MIYLFENKLKMKYVKYIIEIMISEILLKNLIPLLDKTIFIEIKFKEQIIKKI